MALSDLLANFKVGMKCITTEDIKRFYKNGGSLKEVKVSIKLDGVRLHAFVDRREVLHRSYNMKELRNFACLNRSLWCLLDTKKMGFLERTDVMFDGEIVDESGKFKNVMQQLHRINNVDDSGFIFKVFDFWYPKIGLSQRARLAILREMIDEANETYMRRYGDPIRLDFVPHESMEFTSEEHLIEYARDIIKQGHEGIVIKHPEAMYEMRRSPAWVKIVAMETLDLEVIGVEEGQGKLACAVGKFVCKLDNGQTVKVGPGEASHDELYAWWQNPKTVPKVIEVKFKERTPGGSLRHPRFYRVRDDKA